MKTVPRLEGESLTRYADRLALTYNSMNSKSSKKDKGQFFTPSNVAEFMAGLSSNPKEHISVLDPGAGIGILSIAVLEELANNNKTKKVNIVCYENDRNVLPYLRMLLEEAKNHLQDKILLKYSVIEEDFIRSNAHKLTANLTDYSDNDNPLFDIIISNPPYFKISKCELQMPLFRDIISGQPNIYFLFMAISARLLDTNGEMIFITPRSFCSGLYYSKFRKWLIERVSFDKIHLFDSRSKLFASESVLQENIITKFSRRNIDRIWISKTLNGDFSQMQRIEVSIKDVVYKTNDHIFFRIPSNEEELNILRELDKLPYNFFKLGVKVSTGKVVAFRNKQYLQKEITQDSVPLLWMHNIINGRIRWPLKYKNKAIAIKNTSGSKWLLQDAGNYLVLKRFTVKEQQKRFVTAPIFKDDFSKYGCFALDNMVNYIHRPANQLTQNQVKGIAKYLELPAVDLYFRVLNGHTQVNANEVYALPFPSLEQLELFGKANGADIGILEIGPIASNCLFSEEQTFEPAQA